MLCCRFSLGYNPTSVKMAECSYLLDNGADEVDVVVNVSWIKSGKWSQVREELIALHQIIVEKKRYSNLFLKPPISTVKKSYNWRFVS
ncbi:MAG: hypothetical protein IPH36_09560 [Saprospiraceae bacterium]|nr:hypothetical protein [Saprospiraceae bacterium]